MTFFDFLTNRNFLSFFTGINLQFTNLFIYLFYWYHNVVQL